MMLFPRHIMTVTNSKKVEDLQLSFLTFYAGQGRIYTWFEFPETV
jgi:hypothetical protein